MAHETWKRVLKKPTIVEEYRRVENEDDSKKARRREK